MQTVYLNAPIVRRVVLEGPALRIQSRQQADRYLPLARINRIVSRGVIHWHTAALMRCFQMGIPVTFLDREGRLVGIGFGAWPHDGKLSELLDQFFTLPEGPQRLIQWFRSQSRARLLRLLRRQRLEISDLRIRQAREQLHESWREKFPGTGEAPVRAMKTLATAQISRVLADYRINPALLEPGHDWHGLLRYLAGILEWELWDLALSGKVTPASSDYRDVVTVYQSHEPALEQKIRHIIRRLWRWLEHSGAYLP